MNAIAMLEKYGLDKITSVHTVIRNIGDVIEQSPNPLRASNRIIVEFGGTPANNHVDAGIIARCLVEQAHHLRIEYNADDAYQYALTKLKKLAEKLPCLYASVDSSPATPEQAKANETAAECHRIFLEHMSEKNIDIARKIEEQLGLTLSNASYYVSKFRKEIK